MDTGCLCYAAFNHSFVKRHKLPQLSIKTRELRLAKKDSQRRVINKLTYVDTDIDGRREKIYGYVIEDLSYDMILGDPWMRANAVVYDARRRAIRFGSKGGLIVRAKGWEDRMNQNSKAKINYLKVKLGGAHQVLGSQFAAIATRARSKKDHDTKLFAASISDINKALETKRKQTPDEIKASLPPEVRDNARYFTEDENHELPPHRPGVDTKIELIKDEQGREKDIPFGPLYDMSRAELLVLRKTLTDHLDRNWIRASSSAGGAPALFAKKPGGGLRFCVDYRALNSITVKDRYPIPLIKETLRQLTKATWVSKVDVRAAFHKLRVREGDEKKTVFRTRFGSFEWLVTPFGLTGAPSAFQRYINNVLGEFLGDFCSAYLDDVLIYTTGDIVDHWSKVNIILKRLGLAGLKMDPQKSEFAVKQTKYLGFILCLGEGIKVDPEKVKAITIWQAPVSTKGIRSFIGFANFYRDFIPNFGRIAAPLLSLTKKHAQFQWEAPQQKAFEELKQRFIKSPILAMWDDEKETVLEADSSGYVLGGCLSQKDEKGQLKPIAYLSKKLTPAEVNYDIHDKEMLSIIRCMEEWRGMLIGLSKPFTVLSDHKNLRHFMTVRTLNERQMRWSQFLSNFNFIIKFRPGKQAARPDALSRREQDMPQGSDDYRIKNRDVQLIKDSWISGVVTRNRLKQVERNNTNNIPRGSSMFEEEIFQTLWNKALREDKDISTLYKSLEKGERSLPPTLKHLKISLAECSFDARGALRFRDRVWIPNYEPLQTALIQQTHDSQVTGHPGRDSTLAILGRNFFWPGISKCVRRFCRNCDVCGRSHVWRESKKGLLRPLPVPDRFNCELGMDFMTDLPAKTSNEPRYLMVVVDRLKGSVALEDMTSMKAEHCASVFLRLHVRHHGFPNYITSDRGSNWVGDFWTELCRLTGVKQRLSTAFHPQTDGATERMNQEVLGYLRAFITYAQFDWKDLLPCAMLAINNRTVSSLGMSPFFAEHGYNIEPIQLVNPKEKSSAPEKRAQNFVKRIHEAEILAQASMASAQQRMEEYANRKRSEAEIFKVGDRVWLNLKNIQTPQLSKKLSWINAKYQVTKIIDSHSVELNTPSGIWPRFHVDLLKRAATDPLPSQILDDVQPPPIQPDMQEDGKEYAFENANIHVVEKILRSEKTKVGRGHWRLLLVKWKGFAEPTWEPRENLEETEALDIFEAKYGKGDNIGEDAGAIIGRRKLTKRSLLAKSKTINNRQ
ncbi:hypothetical protein K3495_g11617 [Podosphaera aphanis]|nr:hypothetical protein K3495_g11617 [Podosphaera aphanis]